MEPQPDLNPIIEPPPSKSRTWIILFLVLFSLLALSATGYFYLQSQQLKKLTVINPPRLTEPTPASDAPNGASTADWQTYASPISNFQVKLPPNWKILSDQTHSLQVSNQDFNPDLHNGVTPEIGQIIVTFNFTHSDLESFNTNPQSYTSTEGIPITQWDRYIDQSGSFNITTIYRQNDLKIPEFEKDVAKILSTFKFTDSTPTPSSKSLSYTAPKTWTSTRLANGQLTLCLPPKWEIGEGGNIYYNRDPNYQPTITYLQEIPYSSGSRREAYYQFWENEYPNVRDLVTLKEININGNTALEIHAKDSQEPKSSPEGDLAVIWYANDKLWKAGLSSWNMINDSQPAFLKDFYTAISCSF